MRTQNARVGLILFTIYLLLYGGFVMVNAFAPRWMDAVVFRGINLAVVYGIGLILAALVLSAVYGFMCRLPGDGGSAESTSSESNSNGQELE